MKKVYSFLLMMGALGFSFQGSAQQPVLEEIENYSIGDSSYFALLEGNPIANLKTGADVTWDFSNIGSQDDVNLLEILEPAQSEHGDNFTNADYAEVYSNGRENYLNNVGDTVELLGNYEGNLEVEITYTDPFPLLKRPFAYDDTVLGSGARKYTIPGFGATYYGEGESSTHAIGWGTLMLPNDTIDQAMLIKNYQEWTDTSEFGPETYNEVISYRWYVPDSSQFLMAVDTFYLENAFFGDGDSTIVNVQYFVPDNAVKNTSVPHFTRQSGKDVLDAYTAGNDLKVEALNGANLEVDLQLFSVSGNEVKNFGELSLASGPKSLTLQGIKPGIYLLRGTITEQGEQQPVSYHRKIFIGW